MDVSSQLVERPAIGFGTHPKYNVAGAHQRQQGDPRKLLAILFSGPTVLGMVQVLMPINHGQQGRCQPVFQVFING